MKSTDFDLIVKSPGRINFIGEHTDYNGGHVLPAAINLGIEIGFRRKKELSVISIQKLLMHLVLI